MKFTDTQPLEEATPVVPETAGTIAPDEKRVPAGKGEDRSAAPAEAPDAAPGEATAASETYPEAPAGSAGHP